MIHLISCSPVGKNKPVFNWSEYGVIPDTDGTPSLGFAGPVSGISNNILFVAGGANFPDSMPWMGGKKKYYDQAYTTDTDPQNHSFKRYTFPYKVAYSANCSTPSGIICAGGEDENGPLSNVILIQFTESIPIYISLPALPVAITNAAATAIDNNIYIAGGETINATSTLFFKLDLKDTIRNWQQLPDIPHAVSHTILLSCNKEKIFLIGGRRKTERGISELYNNLFEYDINTGKWIEKAPLPYPLSAGTGAIINDDYIAMFGGDKGNVFRKTEQLITAIRKEPDSTKRKRLTEEKKELQTTHPGFSNEILLYNIKNDSWATGGNIPFKVPVTTTAVTKGDKVWIPSGEIKAGIRSPKILEATIK
ncbi:MAG: hypothetical protein QM727_02260 [Niabella sp.]